MLLRVDELNRLKTRYSAIKQGSVSASEDDIIDELLDFLLLAYADAKDDVEESLGKETSPDSDRIESVIYRQYDGKTFEDRAREHISDGDYDALYLLAENERNRVYNTAAFLTAKDCGASTKTWHCMMLPTSRDTHVYLNGTTKGMDEEFYTYNGNAALYPQGFDEPSEDINCLCYCTFN